MTDKNRYTATDQRDEWQYWMIQPLLSRTGFKYAGYVYDRRDPLSCQLATPLFDTAAAACEALYIRLKSEGL